jgi:signal transduction histidine kinase
VEAISQGRGGPAALTDLKAKAHTTLIAVAVMAGTLAFLAYEFAGIVATPLLVAWIGWMALVDLVLLLTMLRYGMVGSKRRWPRSRWRLVTGLLSSGFSLGIVVSVWIFLPPAPPPLQMLCVLLYVWFVAMMMMSSGTLINMIGCLALLASLTGFVITADIPYRWPLVVFFISVGAALVGIRRAIWRAADESAAARALSDRAAGMLEEALALVQAQRDAKTRFIATASHDLQQPLQAARLYVDQLATLPEGAARARALGGAARALGSTQGLIATMLDFLRLEADAEVARPQPVAIRALLEGIAWEHSAVAAEAGVTLNVRGIERWAFGDPVMLRRAVANLVTNALRHSDGRRVLLFARPRGDRVAVWAVDDGRGVAADDRATLFDDYSKGAGANPAKGGFGLGLASVRRLAAAMSGRAGLDARWTRGAAFWIELPAAHAPALDEDRRCAAA